MARRKKKDLVKIIGIIIFVVGIVSYLKANTDLFNKGPEGDCYVDFIDCGQGDSSLIVSNGVTTLIDASTREDGEKVVDHLEERGIKKIDHFLLTHPHEDHIGGAIAVLESFDVENIYMKRPTEGTEPTTSVYLNLLKKIKEQGKTVHAVEVNDSFECGAVTFNVLGPVEDYEDLNDQSVILRGQIGEISFLFTGDQESSAEKDLVAYYGDTLESTVLKVGHHGSSGSSSKAFLQAVAPEIGIISCGEDNSYGHPHDEALKRLEKQQVEIYRTDTQGTITVTTDGKTIQCTEGK
ncbi:MAG: MBL fold metallo-hydrolase [Clostridia bacterium]|nr:MBL fold metallo-hydrolase [Clostridia bacterium]